MGAILRAYQRAKALGDVNSVPFALSGSHWLTYANGELVVDSDGKPHTYWDCSFVLQTTLDSDKYFLDGIRYKIDFFGGYDGVWISRTETLEGMSKPLSIRYYGFDVGQYPHNAFFGYDYRNKTYDYDDISENPKKYRQPFAFKEISCWKYFDANMLLNLLNGNWNKFLSIRGCKKIKPSKSHVAIARMVKMRLVKSLLYNDVIEKTNGKYDINPLFSAEFAEFEYFNSRVGLDWKVNKKQGIVQDRKSKTFYMLGNAQKKEYPMKRRPTVEELRKLLGMDTIKDVQNMMVKSGFRDTYN